jgi:hypothetical protein
MDTSAWMAVVIASGSQLPFIAARLRWRRAFLSWAKVQQNRG